MKIQKYGFGFEVEKTLEREEAEGLQLTVDGVHLGRAVERARGTVMHVA